MDQREFKTSTQSIIGYISRKQEMPHEFPEFTSDIIGYYTINITITPLQCSSNFSTPSFSGITDSEARICDS